MSDARLPINHWDTGKISRDKINDSFNDLVTTVQWYEPHIESWIWWIWTTNTGVKAVWDNVEMKVEDWYIRYKSSSVNQWTQIIAIEDLKWDKWDTWDAATVCVWNVSTGDPWTDVCVTNSGTQYAAVLNFTIPRWATGCKWDTGASICAATFCGDDMVFTKDDGCQVVLCDAKDELKWDTGRAATVAVGCVTTWEPWTSVCIVNTGTCCDAILDFTIPQGVKWDRGNAATITVWNTCTWEPWTCACVTNSWTCCDAVLNFIVPQWLKWDTGDTGARIVSAEFSGDDITFTEDNCCTFILCDAKVCLKWDKGDTWDTWARIVSAEFNENDIVFTEDNSCTVTLCNAKTCLKWDKGDTWNAATITVGTTCTWWAWTSASVVNTGTSCDAIFDFTIPKWDQWDKGDTWASIVSAAFSSDDIVFTKDDSCTVTLCDAKNELKGDKGDTGDTGARIVSAAFSGNDIVFTEDNSCTVTLEDAKTCLKWDKWDTGTAATITVGTTSSWAAWTAACVTNTGTECAAIFNFVIPTGATGATGNGISCTTCTKNWKTTTVTTYYTNWTCSVFTVNDWEDWQGSGDMLACVYDPNNVWGDAFDYCNFIHTPKIPTDNCELANSCGFTTCTWTLVASDLTPYAKTCNLCTVSTTGKYCDLTGQPTKVSCFTNDCGYITWITCANVTTALWYTPYDSTNPNWYTTCTGTLVASDLTPYAKSCTLCTVATSGKYCDLSGRVTDNCQIWNSCWYTTCTGTLSTCSDVISALGYTPYNSNNPSGYTTCTGTLSTCSDITTALWFTPYSASNPSWYTTCTWTLVASDIERLAQCCDIPTDNCQLSNSCGFTTCTGTLVASDLNWYATTASLCAVATSGKYCDLSGRPSLCTVATSGKYCDLTWTPTIPTNNNQLTNWCGYTTCTWTLVASDLTPYAKTCDLASVATSWLYCDLTWTPTLCTVATSGKYCDLSWQPTIWTASLTIQKNWTTVNTFWANATSNVTANITVPTDTCELSNSAWFITSASVPTDNCQLSNGCWYIKWINCSDVTTALWYTPYNSSNPSGYTTCTWTLVASDLTVVSGDTWCVYTIKKSTTAPSGAGSNTITLVVE